MEVEVEDDVGSPLYYTSDFSLNKGYLTPYSRQRHIVELKLVLGIWVGMNQP
jgi:hypothetical protein